MHNLVICGVSIRLPTTGFATICIQSPGHYIKLHNSYHDPYHYGVEDSGSQNWGHPYTAHRNQLPDFRDAQWCEVWGDEGQRIMRIDFRKE